MTSAASMPRAWLRLALGAALAGLLPTAVPATGVAIHERDLIGAWRLVYSEMRMPDGRAFPNPTYGPNPHGYLIYDASHTMCVFLAVGEPGAPPPPELRWADRRTPASYCGRWYIEPSGEAVIHDIEVVDQREPIRGKQRRRATLNGDILTIRSSLPRGLQDYFLRFERVRQNAPHAR